MILFSPLSPNSGKINPVLWKKPYISSNYFLCFAGLLVSHLGQIQNLIPIKGIWNGRRWWLAWCVARYGHGGVWDGLYRVHYDRKYLVISNLDIVIIVIQSNFAFFQWALPKTYWWKKIASISVLKESLLKPC